MGTSKLNAGGNSVMDWHTTIMSRIGGEGGPFMVHRLRDFNMQQASKHDPISVYSILFYNV